MLWCPYGGWGELLGLVVVFVFWGILEISAGVGNTAYAKGTR